MFQQFNISRSGFGMYQKMMFNVTNNISNANTPAFKQTRVELATLFPQILEKEAVKFAGDDEYNPYVKKQKGNEFGPGIRMESISTDFSEGNLQVTNNELDLSINGNGFFQFRKPNGEIVYSRAGNLRKDIDGNITSQSGYLLDPPIRVPDSATQISIDSEGRVFANTPHKTELQEIGQILLAQFTKPDELKNVGNNFYAETAGSGAPTTTVPSRNKAGKVVQFSLESSNVDIIKEMMEMIMARRGLEALGKAMSSGKDMLEKGLTIVS